MWETRRRGFDATKKSLLKDNVKCGTRFSSRRGWSCFCPCLFWTQGRDVDPAALDTCTGLYYFAGLPHCSPNVQLIECDWGPHNTELRSKAAVAPLKVGLVGFRKPWRPSQEGEARWGDGLHGTWLSQVSPLRILVFSLSGYWSVGQLTNSPCIHTQTQDNKLREKTHDAVTMTKIHGHHCHKDFNIYRLKYKLHGSLLIFMADLKVKVAK